MTVQHPDGTLIVEHSDGTRITTYTRQVQVPATDDTTQETGKQTPFSLFCIQKLDILLAKYDDPELCTHIMKTMKQDKNIYIL